MVDLCYSLALTFYGIMMNGDEFSFAIDLRSVFVQLSSQVDHHLDKLSMGEDRWIEFLRSVDVMTGGTHVSHDCCAKVFSWKGLGY